jgi:stearoyl-CoA desaturase (delta-9 desaturase)
MSVSIIHGVNMNTLKIVFLLIAAYVIAISSVNFYLGDLGIYGEYFQSYSWWKILLYIIAMSHITITAMSLSFHRNHTHKGVKFNSILDAGMQIWLWMVTSMSKLDWVSVHVYHHAYSDTEKDPHSPVVKGFWRVFLLGVLDYTKAKELEPVLKIRKTLKTNSLERFIANNLLIGPALLSAFNLVMFGSFWGSILCIINFSISPLFAVGGVNALAHMYGYQNHKSGDNSRNIGFLFPLNFIICGELDHNNHHGHPKSCSFRHRWFEFDIGYFYILILQKIGLAKVLNAYTTSNLKEELSIQVKALIEKDFRFKKKFEEYCQECNVNYQDMMVRVEDYIKGKKGDLNSSMIDFVEEVKRTWRANARLNLSY